MRYEGDIYRPPSEAYSLIVQATVGCTHNACTFCPMYKGKKFRLRPAAEVIADLAEARRLLPRVERVFFADGDAFCMTAEKFKALLDAVRDIFPECERVGVYSRAGGILRKSGEELRVLRDSGLGIIYIGAESGSAEVLRRINKGETPEQLIKAVHRAEGAGIRTSVTFISGLGGRELTAEHAEATGRMIADMGASYVGLLTLTLSPGTPLFDAAREGRFEPLTIPEVLEELERILTHASCASDTVFRSNHASNWLVLRGTLPGDQDRLLSQVRRARADGNIPRGYPRGGL